jgi:hypothetical protein
LGDSILKKITKKDCGVAQAVRVLAYLESVRPRVQAPVLHWDPPDLCLLNSWDYRHELPPALGAQQDRVFKKIIKVK